MLSVLALFGLPLSALSQLMLAFIEVRKAGGIAAVLEADPGWVAATSMRVVYSTAPAAWAVYTLPGFFMKSKKTPLRMQWVYGSVLLGNVVFTIVDAVVAGTAEPLKPNYLQFVLPILWVSYFRSSKRVKETFVR